MMSKKKKIVYVNPADGYTRLLGPSAKRIMAAKFWIVIKICWRKVCILIKVLSSLMLEAVV